MPRNIGLQDLPELLRGMRKGAGITQERMAEIIERGQPTVSVIERGGTPPKLEVLLAWVSACGGRVDVLTDEDITRMNADLGPMTQRVHDLEGRLSPDARAALEAQLRLLELSVER